MSERPESPPAPFSDWEAEVAYRYGDTITTWQLTKGTTRRFLKVRPIDMYPSLADERDRLTWAEDRLPVPSVIDYGVEGDTEWLLLSALPGRDATDPEFSTDPKNTVPLLARGLRDFHGIDARDCPFDFRNDVALAHVKRRLGAGVYHPDYDLHVEFAHLTPEQAARRLEDLRPATEDVVVCHGDYCFPNVLIDAGMVVGYLDLGELGLADRWCDIAVGAWSTTWNVGPGHEELFYESYGVEPDTDRIEFYRLLYSLAS